MIFTFKVNVILKKSISILLMLLLLISTFIPNLQTPLSPKIVEAATNSCSADSVASNTSASSGKVGGVALDQAATFLANMDDITGAYYDQTKNRIVFMGKKNTALPEFDKDDLATAIRAIFFKKTIPAVSIEPTESSGMQDVLYYGGIENTKFGETLFEADLKLKHFASGYDENGIRISTSVAGYKPILERYIDKDSTPTGPFGFRFWLSPLSVIAKQDTTSNSFIFDAVTMQVDYEPLMSHEPTLDQAGEEFATQMTQNYDAYAQETPSWVEAKQLAKIVGVVKWLSDNGIATDFNWAEDYTPAFVDTPEQIPAEHISQTYNGIPYTMTGGVIYGGGNNYSSANGNATALKNASEAINSPKEVTHWNFTSNGQQYEAVAVAADAFRSLGSYSNSVADMSFPAIGDLNLEIARSYSSYSNGQKGIGRGWSFLPAELVDNKPLAQGQFSGSCANDPNTFYRGKLAFQTLEGVRETHTFVCGNLYKYNPDESFYHHSIIDATAPDAFTRHYTVRLKNQTVYTFEEKLSPIVQQKFKLLSVKDKNGNKINYNYDSQNKLTSMSDDNNHTITFSYNANNLVSQISDWTNRSVQYSYDTQGNLLTITDPRNNVTTYTYDENNKLATIVDREGKTVVANTYTPEAKLATQTDASNLTDTFSYDATDRTITATDNSNPNRTATIKYDQRARILESIDPFNNKFAYTYGTEYAPLTIKDKNNNTTTNTYDNNGNLTSITYPDLKQVLFEYNDKHLVTKITDGRYGTTPKVTNFTYDTRGNMTTTDEAGRQTQYTYSSTDGQLLGRTDPLTHSTIWGHDAFGNVNVEINPEDNTKFFYYNNLGRLNWVTDEANKETAYSYDTNNNVTGVWEAIGTSDETLTWYVLDKENRQTRATLPNNAYSQFTYNNSSSLQSVTDPANNTTSYEYDQHQNISSKEDTLNRTTEFEYDKLNRRTSSTTPLGKVAHWEYDANGNINARIDENNETTEYTYDNFNRLTQISYPDTSEINYSYDFRGNMTSSVSPDGTITYEYDIFDRLVKVTDPNNAIVLYEYDSADNLTKVTYPGNKVATYAYTPTNRLATVTDWNNKQTAFEYYLNGLLKKKTLPNGVVSNYTYNNANKLVQIHHTRDNATLAKFDYKRNSLGNIITATESGMLEYSAPTASSSGETELLTNPWTLEGENGSDATSDGIPGNSLNGKESVKVTFNLHGTSFGGGDDEASVFFVQDGDWRAANLTLQGAQNGLNGSQTVTIPISEFHKVGNSNVVLNPNEDVSDVGARFWNSGAFTVDITSIKLVGSTQTSSEYTGEYFDNQALSGTPALTRSDEAIDFTWNDGSPDPVIPNDNFSARWTKTQAFEAGAYKFTTITDDGVRLKIDGVTVIDKWIDQGSTTYTTTQNLTAGNHTIVMEYYENGGGAVAKMSYEQVGGAQSTFSGEYFTNKNLTGSSALTRNDDSIDFDWGGSSPDPSIPVDNFSVRWTKQMNFDAGQYTFSTETDDGVRLYVDDELLINKWIDQGLTEYIVSKNMTAGLHTVRMEYFDSGGGAEAYLHINESASGFTGEYFTNRNLTGSPALTRSDTAVDFDWNTDSPDPSIPIDNFSVRWTKTQQFAAGTYTFSTTTDDGVKLFIDNNLVIDKWIDQGSTTYTATQTLSAGNHTIKMEYYDSGWTAVAKLNYGPAVSYIGEYYNNKTLSGSPVLTRDDASIDFDWGGGSPDASVPADNFSVRWTKTVNFTAGNYQFSTTTDDGVRLKIDGATVIDHWIDQGPTTYNTTQNLTAGEHTIVMEYFDSGGGAVAELSYQQIASNGVFNRLIAAGLENISNLFTFPTATAQTTPNTFTIDYTYDVLSRLTKSANSLPIVNEYTYDKVGNILTSKLNSVLSTSTYNNDNQLTQKDSTTFAYDNNGNQTDRGNKDLTYDFENKLKSITNPNGPDKEYLYDGIGNRFEEKTNGTSSIEYVNDVSSDLTNVLIAKNLSTNSENYYLYGAGLISQGGVSEQNREYYLKDGLGNVRLITDSSGNVIETYSYDPYGNELAGENTSSFRFKGEQPDISIGLYYMRARYYDPTTGRFISKDPVAGVLDDPRTLNGYDYALNNPINNSDPSGEFYVPGALFLAGGLTLAGLEVGGAIYGATTSCNPVRGAIVGAQNAVESPVGQAAIGIATVGMMMAGPPGSSNNMVQSTGRASPTNLNEQLAMEQVMSNPTSGKVLSNVVMGDPRWLASKGWVKMEEVVNGITIHWNLNTKTGATADFKFK